MPIFPVTAESELDRALEAPLVVVVKDSPRCIQCAAARRQLRKFDRHQEKRGRPVDSWLLNVLEHRALSDRLASRFQLRHESPQAFLLRRGELLWSGSHFSITWRKLVAQVEAADGVATGFGAAAPNEPR